MFNSPTFITLNLNESSEILFGITQQPSPTCPLIDGVIDNLSNSSDRETIERLEVVREHVKKIRAWGEEWKQLALRNKQ